MVGDAYRTASDGFFKWRDGRLTVFGQLEVGADRAVAVNRSGTMAVWTSFDTSFRYQDGHVRDLGSLGRSGRPNLGQRHQRCRRHRRCVGGAGLQLPHVLVDPGNRRGPRHPGRVLQTAATAINGNGQILGVSYTASGESHVVIWHNGGITDLGTLAAGGTTGADMNDKGQIVGSVTTAAATDQRLRVEQRCAHEASSPAGRRLRTAATAINERGDVVGESSTDSGDRHAVVWSGGSVRDLGTLGGSWTRPWGSTRTA